MIVSPVSVCRKLAQSQKVISFFIDKKIISRNL